MTKEQQLVVDTVCDPSIPSDVIVAVEAVAGSGKSSTAKACIEAYKPRYGLYTAFNKSVISDGDKKFGNLINCKTLHALAYRYANTSRVSPTDLTVYDIKENVELGEKYKVIKHIDEFFRSKHLLLDSYIEEVDKRFNESGIEDYRNIDCLENHVKDLIFRYADLMLNGKIKPTFNYLLKAFHCMLDAGLKVDYDLLILDECQDVVNVTFEIFKLIKAKRKLILGDSYQNIYSFMNTKIGRAHV